MTRLGWKDGGTEPRLRDEDDRVVVLDCYENCGETMTVESDGVEGDDGNFRCHGCNEEFEREAQDDTSDK